MDWLEVAIVTDDEKETEKITDLLYQFAEGDEGVAVEQIGDPDDVDPNALLPEIAVKLYVALERADTAFKRKITETFQNAQLPTPQFAIVRQQDWANAWKEHYRPTRIGKRFIIQPSWLEPEPTEADDILIHMDPGMAFGTGTHETTRLCLTAIEETVQPGMSVLDIGTGSGILAIGAAKLGASPILAIDNDPLAVTATVQNSAENQTPHAIEVREAILSDIPKQQWDVVVANILAPIVIDLLENGLLNYVTPTGTVILSGILAVQSSNVQEVIARAGGQLLKEQRENDWVALTVCRA